MVRTHTVGRLLSSAAWLAPALVFAFAGAAKLVDPVGTAPRLLEVSGESWRGLLRALGVVECAIALLVLLPRTRRAGLCSALGALALFCAAAALLAADRAFVTDCGCLGAFGLRPTSASAALTAILLRNAVLGGLAAAALARRGTAAARWQRGLVVAALLFAAPFALGQVVLRRAESVHVSALQLGARRAAALGWELPDCAVRGADGTAARMLDVLRGGDVIVFVAPACDACMRHASGWTEYDRRLRGAGRRLVIAGVGPLGELQELLRAHRCADLPHVALEDPLAALRLGVLDTPRTLVLDGARRVLATDALAPPAEVAAALLDAGSGASETVHALACRVLGDRVTAVIPDPARRRRYAVERDAGRARLALLESAQPTAEHLLLAVGTDGAGRIEGLVVLAASALIRAADPDLQRPALLHGLTVPRALESARALAHATPFEAPLWHALGRALQQLEPVDAPR